MKHKELTGISRLIADATNQNFKAYSNDSVEKINEAIRAKFNELLPKADAFGNFKRRDIKKALPECFAILEENLDISVNQAWHTDPFYNTFVDSRNLALGDKQDFVVEDKTVLVANKFAGGTWMTDRQKLNGRQKISFDTEWFYIHVYDDFERFRTGAVTIDYLMNKMTEAFVRCADTLVATTFNDAANNLPADFSVVSTLSSAEMRELISKVKTYSRKNVNILGTEMAISQLNELADVKYSNDMMNEVYSTGRLGRWNGIGIIEIPQAFVPGTYNWAVDNDVLLVVPETEKFIKFIDEGETMSRELTEVDSNDQTLSWQLQRKFGCAAIFGSVFGKYQIV